MKFKFKSCFLVISLLILGNISFGLVTSSQIENDSRKLTNCNVSFNLSGRATYTINEIRDVFENRSGLIDIGNILLSCQHIESDKQNYLVPIKFTFKLTTEKVGSTPIVHLSTIHSRFHVYGSADLNNDNSLYIKANNEATILDYQSVDILQNGQSINYINETDVKERIKSAYGNILEESGLLPNDVFTHEICMYHANQSISDQPLTCTSETINHINPKIDSITLFEVFDPKENEPITFQWSGIDNIRDGVSVIYKFRLWKSDTDSLEFNESNPLHCINLENIEIENTQITYPTNINGCESEELTLGTYYWQVEAFDGEGYQIKNGLSSEFGQFIIQPSELLLLEPFNEAFVVYNNESISFSWSDIDLNYNIYISDDKDQLDNLTDINPMNRTNALNSATEEINFDQIENFKPNTPFYWVIEAYDNNFNKVISEIYSFTVSVDTIDSSYQEFTTLPIFNWNPIQGTDYYKIYISEDANIFNQTNSELPESSNEISETTETNFAFSSLEVGTEVNYLKPNVPYYLYIQPIKNDLPWVLGSTHEFSINSDFTIFEPEIINDSPPYSIQVNWNYLENFSNDVNVNYHIRLLNENDENILTETIITQEKSISIKDEDTTGIIAGMSYRVEVTPKRDDLNYGESIESNNLQFSLPELLTPIATIEEGSYPIAVKLSFESLNWQPNKVEIEINDVPYTQDYNSEINLEEIFDFKFDSKYSITVKALNENNDTYIIDDQGQNITIKTAPFPKIRPSWTNAQFKDDEALELTWEIENDTLSISSFTILISEDSNCKNIVLSNENTINSVTFDSIDQLIESTEYFICIKPNIDDQNLSEDIKNNSEKISFTIKKQPEQIITLKSPSSGAELDNLDFSFSWSKLPNIENYIFKYSKTKFSKSDKTSMVELSNNELSASDILLEPNQRYYWSVTLPNQDIITEVFSFNVSNIDFPVNYEIDKHTISLAWQPFNLENIKYEISIKSADKDILTEIVENKSEVMLTLSDEGNMTLEVKAKRDDTVLATFTDEFEIEESPAPELEYPIPGEVNPKGLELSWTDTDEHSESFTIKIYEGSESFVLNKTKTNTYTLSDSDADKLVADKEYKWSVTNDKGKESERRELKIIESKNEIEKIIISNIAVDKNNLTFQWNSNLDTEKDTQSILLLSSDQELPNIYIEDTIDENNVTTLINIAKEFDFNEIIKGDTNKQLLVGESYFIKVYITNKDKNITLASSKTISVEIKEFTLSTEELKKFIEEKIIPIIKANPKLSVDDSYSLDSFSVIPSDLKNIILNAIDLENITIKEINK